MFCPMWLPFGVTLDFCKASCQMTPFIDASWSILFLLPKNETGISDLILSLTGLPSTTPFWPEMLSASSFSSTLGLISMFEAGKSNIVGAAGTLIRCANRKRMHGRSPHLRHLYKECNCTCC